MIDLGTIDGIHEHPHESHAHCLRRDHWRVLDLAGMVLEGRGALRLPLAARCRDCGATSQLQVRQRMAAHPRAARQMETAPG